MLKKLGKRKILSLKRLENDNQLCEAIYYLYNHYLCKNKLSGKSFEKLSDLILEYEERTDILNR